MKCPNCGKEIANDSVYCEYCGEKVVQLNSLKKNKLGKISLFVIGGIVALSLLGWAGYEIMEEIEEQQLQERAESLSAQGVSEWIDLGLPSGTLWYGRNEDGPFFDHFNATIQFGNQLPTKQQFDELIQYCTCTWEGEGYLFVGPNGNSIFLPAAGYISNTLVDVGSFAMYWSSTSSEPEDIDPVWGNEDQAWALALGHDCLNPLQCNSYEKNSGYLVRLVSSSAIAE
jgi:hypothetical protein